ncbi:uncharacterized protein LOC130498571 isoform X2 [Raphanus sativus]|uniref:Uncharacterized protein LOC130498571 isoform X2 n=1 Tax=Raphanus sativus TaxID=3726 RepID=A0A9W3C8Y4_RAPSA|nr:uncharacterized protein LOC130498571 isoform X2 [Raphanus sativus]
MQVNNRENVGGDQLRVREKPLEKQRLFQSIQRHTYLKGPMDKVTSVAIPLALAASSLYLIGCKDRSLCGITTKKHYCSESGLKLQASCSLCIAYL